MNKPRLGSVVATDDAAFKIVENNLLSERTIGHLFTQAVPPLNGLQLVTVHQTATQSLHIARLWTREKRHLHATHDSTILLQSSSGTLYMNDFPVPLQAGDMMMIPRGVPHYYVNDSSTQYSQVFVVFTPPYDGQDTVPLPTA